MRFESRKCVKMRLRPGDTAGGAYSAPPDPVAGFEGRKKLEKERGGKERGGRGGKGKGREDQPLPRTKILATALALLISQVSVSAFSS